MLFHFYEHNNIYFKIQMIDILAVISLILFFLMIQPQSRSLSKTEPQS
jgi:hypothetical protein